MHRWNPAICLIQAKYWLWERLFGGRLIKAADFARILPTGQISVFPSVADIFFSKADNSNFRKTRNQLYE
jgi:hypothetical protein